MFQNTSLFGLQSTDPAARAAFDLCILDELELKKEKDRKDRDRKKLELRKPYGFSELREEDG